MKIVALVISNIEKSNYLFVLRFMFDMHSIRSYKSRWRSRCKIYVVIKRVQNFRRYEARRAFIKRNLRFDSIFDFRSSARYLCNNLRLILWFFFQKQRYHVKTSLKFSPKKSLCRCWDFFAFLECGLAFLTHYKHLIRSKGLGDGWRYK